MFCCDVLLWGGPVVRSSETCKLLYRSVNLTSGLYSAIQKKRIHHTAVHIVAHTHQIVVKTVITFNWHIL